MIAHYNLFHRTLVHELQYNVDIFLALIGPVVIQIDTLNQLVRVQERN